MFFALMVFLVAIFHREILFEILEWVCQATRADSGRAEVRLRASLNRSPQLYFMKNPILETMVISKFARQSLWVSAEVWGRLSQNEQECLLIWAQSSLDRHFLISRILGFDDPRTADRDCLVLASDPLALVSALDKLQEARGQRPPSHLGTLLTGLSLLGPPLLKDGIAANDRMKAYADQLTRLRK